MPVLYDLLNKVSEGDVVVVHSLDRINCSTVDLLQLFDQLKKRESLCVQLRIIGLI
ncbi:recombinase family protein [Evansella sp. AB-rgal1]|uniref:recombinase family protein n=1 Tax=Evansella sp. AB-rgal1 TaxID=3242696 RepID=UPI00359D0939